MIAFVLPLLAHAQGSNLGGYSVKAKAASNGITIYVKADAAPHLYVWEGAGVTLNGGWPGNVLTETKEVKGTTFYYKTFTPSTGSINIIFNNGSGGDGNQTKNIEGLTSDRYYTYDGGSGCEDVTAQYKDPEPEPEPVMPEAPEVLPSYKAGEVCAFFAVPASVTNYAEVSAWVWSGDGQPNYTGGNWPGEKCEKLPISDSEKTIWKWTYTGELTELPEKIIFNNSKTGDNDIKLQTADMKFVNGGYYKTTTGTRLEDCTTGKVAEVEGTNDDIVSREFTANQYATVCLPYAVSAEEMANLGGKFYAYTGEAEGILSFTAVKELEALTPYVYIADKDGQNLASLAGKEIVDGDLVAVTNGNFTFKGTKTRKNLITNKQETYYGYKAADNTFVKVGFTKGAKIDAWKAYFITSTAEGAEAKSSLFDSTPTAINQLKQLFNNAADDAVYTIDGKKVGAKNLPQGLYIYNGKKIIIK